MKKILTLLVTYSILSGCSSYPPIVSEKYVELDKFMGDWYVIANIPTFIEEGAHNAIETYKKNPDGSIATTFSFNDGSFEGKKKIYNPTGYVVDETSNAIWEMQFLWPFKSDYRIMYVDKDYKNTIIGRIKRDYVWIMSRTPSISDDEYKKLVKLIKSQKYDVSKLELVPQQPLNERLNNGL